MLSVGPKLGTTGNPREDAKCRQRAIKKLNKIIDEGGYNSLFGDTFVAADPEKLREKRRKVVLEAMAFRVDEQHPIPRALLDEVGLTPESNPRVQDTDTLEAPF